MFMKSRNLPPVEDELIVTVVKEEVANEMKGKEIKKGQSSG